MAESLDTDGGMLDEESLEKLKRHDDDEINVNWADRGWRSVVSRRHGKSWPSYSLSSEDAVPKERTMELMIEADNDDIIRKIRTVLYSRLKMEQKKKTCDLSW